MTALNPHRDDVRLEACIDDLGALLESAVLMAYDEPTVAYALRSHLAALLHALHERGACSRLEVEEFARELMIEAVEPPPAAAAATSRDGGG